MQASDTAYPRLKSNFNAGELDRWYTPTLEDRAFCALVVRGPGTRLGFLLLLKTFQRLGYFMTSDQIPDAIIGHLAKIEKQPVGRQALAQYQRSCASSVPPAGKTSCISHFRSSAESSVPASFWNT